MLEIPNWLACRVAGKGWCKCLVAFHPLTQDTAVIVAKDGRIGLDLGDTYSCGVIGPRPCAGEIYVGHGKFGLATEVAMSHFMKLIAQKESDCADSGASVH